jgi:hypothetical protein
MARDNDTSRETLELIARTPGSQSVDLLYEVWTGTTGKSDATKLAEALVYTDEIRKKASKGLAIALDLRVAESCETNQAILPRAIAEGDKRSLHLLGKLNAKKGCGPKKLSDCNPCLRKDKQLADATRIVRSKNAPKY